MTFSVSVVVFASALVSFDFEESMQFYNNAYATIAEDTIGANSTASNSSGSAPFFNSSLIGSDMANSTQDDTELGNSSIALVNFSTAVGPLPGTLQIPYTGLSRYHISPEDAKLFGLNENTHAMVVTEVEPRSPAAMAGIRGGNLTTTVRGDIVKLGGDLILRMDGNDTYIRTNEAFLNYLQNEKKVGENVTLTVLRNGQTSEINMTIGVLPRFLWYDDIDESIRIKYPSDWEISETVSVDEIVKFFTPQAVRIGNETEPAAGIFVLISAAGDLALDDLAEREQRDRKDRRNLDITLTSISNLPAYEAVFYDYSDNRTLKKLSTFTINDGMLYRIDFSTDPSRYNDYLPIAKEVIKSFQFTK